MNENDIKAKHLEFAEKMYHATFDESRMNAREITNARAQIPSLGIVPFRAGYQAAYMQLEAKLKLAVEAAKLGLSFAPKGEVPKGLDPMFYHSLDYEYELNLQHRIDKARSDIAKIEAGE